MDKNLFEAVDRYIDELFVFADPILDAAIKAAEDAEMPAIQVSAGQGKFLYLLAKLRNARRILEIGTLAGYSTIWLGRALPADGRLISLELSPRHAEVARASIARAQLADRVEIRTGPALDSLAQMQAAGEAPFDLIFIDADKPGYPAYLQAIMALARPGTLILADNVVRAGMVLDPNTTDEMAQGARNFNITFAKHPQIEAIILQQIGVKGHDGLALGIVR